MGNQVSLCSSNKTRPSSPNERSYVSLPLIQVIDSTFLKVGILGRKENWDEEIYETVRSIRPDFYGLTSVYLVESADHDFSSSAETSTLVELAKIDLKKGTTIPELVFTCCQYFPKKEAIESLIELEKQNENEKKAVESVFDFQNH